jgi:hypothetical protein
MDEYLILMRLDLVIRETPPSPEQMEQYMKQYQDWVGGIAAQNKFVGGTALSMEGKVIRPKDIVTDGPFAEIKEWIAGFITIRAKDFDEAVRLAKGCPILNGEGNSVEVRRLTTGQHG